MAAPDRITLFEDNPQGVQRLMGNEAKHMETASESAAVDSAGMGPDRCPNFNVNGHSAGSSSSPQFSIREYVAKVRSVDMSKCWPLSARLLEHGLRSERRDRLLPPLDAPKYRWWACDRFLENEEGLLLGERLIQLKTRDIEAAAKHATEKDDIIDRELTLVLDPFADTDHEDFILGEVDETVANIAGAVYVSGQASYSTEEPRDMFDKCAAHGSNDNKNNIGLEGNPVNGDLQQVNGGIVDAPAYEGKYAEPAENVFHEKTGDSQPHFKRQTVSAPHDELELTQIHVQHTTLDDTTSKVADACQKNEIVNKHDKIVAAGAGGQTRAQLDDSGERFNSEGNMIESHTLNAPDQFNSSEASVLKMCPVCKTFTSTTITTVNAHMDNCLAQVSKMEINREKMLKHKARAQKKRSLADICAAALPVPTVKINGPNKNDLPASSCSSDSPEPDLYSRAENSIQRQSRTPIHKGSEMATTINGRKKRTSKMHSFQQNGNLTSEDRHPESLEMKRKRQRLGITQTSVSGSRDIEETVKAVRVSSTIHLSGMHQDALQHQSKPGKAVMNVDYLKDEQQLSKEVHSEHDDDVPMDVVELMAKNQLERCARLPSHNILKEHITTSPNEQHSATTTIEKVGTLECSFTDIQHEGNFGRSLGEVSIHEPNDKCSITIISDHIGKAALLAGEEGPMPSSSESSDAATKRAKSLDNEECRHCDRDNAGTGKFEPRDFLAKLEDPDMQINKQHMGQYGDICTSAGAGKSQKFTSVNEEQTFEPSSKASCRHPLKQNSLGQPSVLCQHAEVVKSGDNFIRQTEGEIGQHFTLKPNQDKDKNKKHLHIQDGMVVLKTANQSRSNSRSLHCLQNEAICSYSRLVVDSSAKTVGTNINQKLVVPPRDSKGRFTNSGNTNGQKEGFSLFDWRQAVSRKSTKPCDNTSADVDRSTSIQNNMGGCNDYGGNNPPSRYKSVASESLHNVRIGQTMPCSGELNMLCVCREDINAKSALSNAGASTPQNATNLVRFCLQKRCVDDGFIGLPLNSQGEFIKFCPNYIAGTNQLYMGQPFLAKGSKGYPESMFVMNTFDPVTMEDQTRQISQDSTPCIQKCLPQQIYSNRVDQSVQYYASKINHLEIDREDFSQAPLSYHILAKEMDVRSSELKHKFNANEIPDISSNLPTGMDAFLELGSKGNQNQKYSTIKKATSAIQNLKKEPLATQPVMRLMGKNFTIGCENEAGHGIKELHMVTRNTAQSSSEAIAYAQNSSIGHISHCMTNTDAMKQLCLSEDCEITALYQHPRGADMTLAEKMPNDSHKNFRRLESLETTTHISDAAKEVKKLNSDIPALTETRFPSNHVPHGQYFEDKICYLEKAWNSIPATSPTETCIPLVSCLSSNPSLNQVDKEMPHKYCCKDVTAKLGRLEPSSEGCSCHGMCFQNIPVNLRGHIRVPKNQIYKQNQNLSPMHHACQNRGCSGCTHSSFRNRNTVSPPLSKSDLPQWLLNAQKQKEAKETSSYKRVVPESDFHGPLTYPAGIASVTKQNPCEIGKPVPLFAPLPYVRCVFSHPTSIPTLSHGHCQPSSISSSVGSPSSLAMQEQQTSFSLDLFERRKVKLSSGDNDRSKIKHEEMNIVSKAECMSLDGRCQEGLIAENKWKTVQGTEGLPGEMFLQNQHELPQGSLPLNSRFLIRPKKHMKKTFNLKKALSSPTGKHPKGTNAYQNNVPDGTSAEICRITENPVVFTLDTDRHESVNTSNKRTIETVSNAPLQIGVSPKLLRSGIFTKSNNNPLENQVQTSRIGLHCQNAESALKLVEPVKLSGGAKHILKPPPMDANATQSLPTHYTLPFARAGTREREKDSQGEHRYSDEHPSLPQGSKYVRWVSKSSWLHIQPNGEGSLPHEKRGWN